MYRLTRFLARAVRFVRARLASLWWIERPGGLAVIRLRYPLVMFAFGLVFLWYLARPSAIAVVAVVGLGGLLLAGYFWARQMATELDGRRQLIYAAVQVGDEIEETVYLKNDSILPALWVEFSDHSNIPGYSLTSARAADGDSASSWRAHSICTLRGNYHFGPWEMISGDPFGLFQVTISYTQREDILVYPPLAALPAEILPRGRSMGDDRPLHQPLQAESMSALTTRPYAPGDPLRRIHWPTTARRDSPFVKVFDPEAASTVWLVPDLDRSVQRGAGVDSTFETMVILLASLSDRLLNQRLAVGLIACGEAPAVVMPAHDKPHLWQLLRLLAGLEAGPVPYERALAQARAVVSSRQRVIAVTPSLQPAWAGELSRLGGARQRSGAEVILLDPDSFASPPAGAAPAYQAGGYVSFLASLGIPAHVVRRGDIRPLAGSYGDPSRWEFLTLGTGRAYARHAPRKAHQHYGLSS